MDIVIQDGVFFRKLVGVIKDLSTTAEFTFNEKGISMQCMDMSHVCLIDILIPAESMESFDISGIFKLGVNFENFNNVLKLSKHSPVSLKFIEGSDKLSIDVTENKVKKINFDMLLTNVEVEALEVPADIKYQFIVFMETESFQKSIKDLSTFGDKCTITITENDVTFEVTGEAGTGQICIADAEIEVLDKSTDSIKFIFNTRYLVMFAKANLSDEVSLKFSNSFPFCCEYTLSESVVRFYLAQITQDQSANAEDAETSETTEITDD